MSSRIEILNSGGYRSDGRRQYELRNIAIDLSARGTADGAAEVSQGLTTVVVEVHGPREPRMRAMALHDRANVNVEVGIAMVSASERRRRGRGDKRILELASTIRSTFEPVIQTSLYPRTQIDIFVQILAQDGSVLSACINATTLALVTAGIPLLDFVCAVSGGVHTTSPLLDLTLLEENDVPHVTVGIMPRTGRVTLATMETRLHAERFEEIFRLACDAGKVLHEEMKTAVKNKTEGLLNAFEAGSKNQPQHVNEDDIMVI